MEALFDRVFDLYIYYDYVETGDPEIGDKVLESDSSDKFYMYMDVTDPYGKPVHLVDGAESYLGIGSNMYIDGKLVWCVEPEVPTGDGSKYNATIVEADDSTRYAAIITQAYKTYESENKELIHAAAQGLIWKSLGYNFDVKKMRISYEDEDGRRQLRELTSDEIVEIDDFIGYVDRLFRSYTDNAKANFALVTGQTQVGNEVKYVTVPGGIPSFIEGKLPDSIMFTGDKLILNLYKHGVIQMPEGVTAEIDEAAGLIKLILDPSLKAGKYYAYFSMIEEDMLGDSVLFTSKYDKQKLMRYGLDKAIRESLKFVIRPQGKPTLPDEPNEPEKPDKPNKPNTPNKPNKPSKPNEPEKPEVPKQPESVKPTQPVSEIPTATSTNTFAFVTMSAIALVGATFVLRRKEY